MLALNLVGTETEMEKNMKRLLKLGLVVSMAFTILGGCGSSNNLQDQDVDH